MPIREWPESTHPRERLVARGASSLSDDELIALLVGSGTRQRSDRLWRWTLGQPAAQRRRCGRLVLTAA